MVRPAWPRDWPGTWRGIHVGCSPVTDLKEHFAQRSASTLLTSRLSKHPERYLEIFRVFRKYELHHIVAELGMSHTHAEDEELVETEHDDEHGMQLACALEEL